MDRGASFWPAAFELVKAGFPGIKQDGDPTHHMRGVPHNGQIDSHWPLDKIERFIRAMTFPPLPYAKYQEKSIHTLAEYLQLSKWKINHRLLQMFKDTRSDNKQQLIIIDTDAG